MRSAKIVIGAAFGDEGKGLMVDKYAADGASPIVCRFSGGANAGHTVVTPEGTRHVFAHFGAGTLAGAATHLSRHFIVNPLLWKQEAAELQAIGAWSKTTIDPEALMSTPYDMLINQFVEDSRGEDRHGSVGVGINETVDRCAIPLWHTPAAYAGKHFLKKTLIDIREGYVFQRLNSLGIIPTAKQAEILNSDRMIDDFVEAARQMSLYTSFADAEILLEYGTIIFEGSQGLLLDEKHRFFPHVTRARTGLTNVVKIANSLQLDELDVTYVTRAYTTRHGAGPLPNEDDRLRYHDDTNAPNDWQGRMRFAPLNTHLLGDAVLTDLARSGWDKGIIANLCVTHIDQINPDDARFVADAGRFHQAGRWEHLVRYAEHSTGVDNAIVSFGQTRNHIISFEAAQRKTA